MAGNGRDGSDANGLVALPIEYAIQYAFNENKLVGAFNWPLPNDLTFPHPPRNLTFTREGYAELHHVVTKYEYCAREAKRIKGDEWRTTDRNGKAKDIKNIWKSLDNDQWEKSNNALYLLYKYTRETKPIGALQRITSMMVEYFGAANVATPKTNMDFPESESMDQDEIDEIAGFPYETNEIAGLSYEITGAAENGMNDIAGLSYEATGAAENGMNDIAGFPYEMGEITGLSYEVTGAAENGMNDIAGFPYEMGEITGLSYEATGAGENGTGSAMYLGSSAALWDDIAEAHMWM